LKEGLCGITESSYAALSEGRSGAVGEILLHRFIRTPLQSRFIH